MHINSIRKNIFLYPFLLFASMVYRLVTDIRNFFYNFGIFKTHQFNIPVISVGNISTGGTGKTPFIMYLIDKLNLQFKNIVVVSRGYGRESRGMQIVSDGKGKIVGTEIGGDEPVLIATKFPNIPVIVSEKRSNGISLAIKKFNANLVLLDDAFQHRNVHRDCDIVLVNAKFPVENDNLLPLGNLRENKRNLKRADIVLITKIDAEESISHKMEYYHNFGVDIYLSKYFKPMIYLAGSPKESDIENINDKKFISFSGLADPQSFKSSLEKIGLTIVENIPFKDHNTYNENDIRKIMDIAHLHNCKNIITTEKDLTKLNPDTFDRFNLFVAAVKMNVKDEKNMFNKIQNCIDSKS